MGDPEHFKPFYAGEWAKHRDDTQELKRELETTHPKLLNTMKLGYGADSADYKEFSPDEKAEPSITIHKDFHEVCCIWTTGSDKITPRDSDMMWVRPDKLLKVKIKTAQKIKCWIYLKYPKARYVLELDDILPYETNTVERNLYGVRETFIDIPVSKGKSVDTLHDWIKNNY